MRSDEGEHQEELAQSGGESSTRDEVSASSPELQGTAGEQAQQDEQASGEPGEESRPLLPSPELSTSVFQPDSAYFAAEAGVPEVDILLPGDPSTSGRSAFEVEAGVDQASVMKRINWHILPIFFSLAMLCAMDRANLSFASPQLNHDLHFSDRVYGLGSGIFFVGYAVFTIPSTFICARVGAPIFLGSILVMWGLVASLFAVMTNRWQFYVLRFLLGLTESGAYPGMWYLLHQFYDEKELGVAYTIIATASSLSGVAGGPIAAELLELDGKLHLHGWQWLFLLEGFPAVLLGVGILVYLSKSPEEAKFLRPEEKAWLAKRWLSAIWATANLCMDILVFWIPLMLQKILYGERDEWELGVGEDAERELLSQHAVHIARLASIPFGMAAASMVLLAYSAKAVGERPWHISMCMVVGSAALFALPIALAKVAWLAVALLTLSCIGVWGNHGPLLSWPAAILEGTAAAAGFSLMKMVGSMAAFVGNAAMGALHDATGTFTLPLCLMGTILLFGAFLTLTFREPGLSPKIDLAPIFWKLHSRVGLKRSRSDPTESFRPRALPTTLSTIRENVARPYHGNDAAAFAMPELPISHR